MSKDAGRILRLKEVLRITDESGDFYFKYPRDLKIAPDGSIFLRDEDQILKFSPEGEFVSNFFKKGQGPGEISGWNFPFVICEGGIYVYDNNPRKIIHFDNAGNLLEEFSFKSEDYRNFFGVLDGCFIFMKTASPPMEGRTPKLYDIKHIIFLVFRDGEIKKESSVIPVKEFLGPNYGKAWAPFRVVITKDNQQLYVNHTCEHRIDLLDINRGEVIRSFSRKYPRIKYEIKSPHEREFDKKHNAPQKKFENDISGLFLCRANLWVETSTIDKNKGGLFDVFNEQGQFIDSFYINLKGSLMAVHEDSIFVLEADEEENMQIVKYRIEEGIDIP